MRIKMTDDVSFRESIQKALKENDGYCPCRVRKTDDTKCMCKEFRDQFARGEKGECHCGLYVIYDEKEKKR
jgi:ferredoxin-thioredoxin reductase catalytic subunit